MFENFFAEFESELMIQKEKTFRFTLKIITIVLIYFILKFNLKYHYYQENMLMIPGFLFVLSSKFIVERIFKNKFAALFAFLMGVFFMTGLLIFLTGGMRAPGALWICIMPFIAGTILGRRGYLPGLIFVVLIFSFYFVMDMLNRVPFPYANNHLYFKETRTNLILFSVFALTMVSNYFRTEEENKSKVISEKTKNENLLKILFNDLANPLQNIRMILKKLNQTKDPIEQLNGIGKLDDVSLRMVETLDQVRKMKALDEGKINIEIKPIMIRDAFKKAEQLLSDQITLKKIKINILNDTSDATVVMVDEVYFVLQVLCNILSNAIKFSELEGEVFISWIILGDQILIEIRDQGTGMPQNLTDNIFNNINRSLRKGTFGEVGTGYGMPLVKSFTEEFKGEVRVYSVEKTVSSKNHGTTITLKFPRV